MTAEKLQGPKGAPVLVLYLEHYIAIPAHGLPEE